MLAWPPKDPNDKLDYSLDWRTQRLVVGDNISASEWFTDSAGSPQDLVIDSDDFDADVTTVWLRAGVAGTTYIVTNRVTTDAGRIMDQSVKLKVKEK
jgi:hypothetical protein